MVRKFLSHEQLKLINDSTRHMTTLSTASILVLVSFYEKFFQNSSWKFLIVLSLISFVICIVASVYSIFTTMSIDTPVPKEEAMAMDNVSMIISHLSLDLSLLASYLSFIFGIIMLCVYGVKNI